MIKTLEELRQGTRDPFLRDLIDTAYHWRTPQEAPRRGKTGRVETITETPQTFQEAAKQLVYWGGVLERPKVLVDIGEQVGDTGSGALTRISGAWQLIDYLTQNEGDVRYATRFHAPTHQWDGDDPLVGQQIAGLREEDRPMWAAVRLDPDAPTPTTRRIGDIFWDPDNHCHSFVLEGNDTIWQGPMEDLLYGQNDSGVPHLNGMVGYIKGSQGQRPTIDISRADDRLKSLAVVFATEASIAANNSGYYTSRGFVRDVDTSGMAEGAPLWLQAAGGYGTSKPSPGLNTRNISLGHVVNSHATTGSVFADITAYPFVDELSGVGISGLKDGHQLAFNGSYWQNQPSRLHRWPINPDLTYNFTLSYSTANRRPTLTPTGSSFDCWTQGERRIFTGVQDLPQHPNTTGQYFYYVDLNGVPQYGTMGYDLGTMVPICIVEWDAAKGDGWCRPELHTTEVTPLWHQREHDVDGTEAALRTGFSISGYTYDLDTVAGVTFGVSGGNVWDEDARSVISALNDGSTYAMFYKSGASGAWTWDEGMTLPYKEGTTYPTVNTFTGGTWTQTEVNGAGAAVYFNTFVIAAPCVNKTQIILVQGQGSFASQALAEAQTWDTMDLSGLAWKEFVALYQVIYKSQAAWSATTKKTEMALAKKITRGSGSSGVGASNEHNALTGRDALDCHPSLSITDIYALSVGNILKRVSLGVAAAVPNTDYLPGDNPTFTGTLTGPRATLTEFGKLQALVGDANYAAIYGTGVTPSGSNYMLRLADDGGSSALNAAVFVDIAIGGATKATVKATELALASGVALKMSATTVIDASRNITGTSLKANSLAAATVRPATIGTDGLLGAQDPAAFLGLIGAAPSHTHPYLPINNPPYTGRLTGPTQYLEADEQIHLAIRRPGGNSGRIHGVAFQAQNDSSAWVEFGRVMVFLNSVTAGAHSGGMRLMAYNAGAILQALEASYDGVKVGAGLALKMDNTVIVDSSRNGSFVGLVATGNPEFGSTSAGSSLGINSKAGTTASVNLKDNGAIRATLQLYEADAFRLVARDGLGVEVDQPLLITLPAGGEILSGGATNRPWRHTGAARFVGPIRNDALAGPDIRPVVTLADGTLDDQDATTFRFTISAASAIHDHTSITGSAAKLTTPRSIGMTGDGAWSVSFDGSANVSGAMTLASIIAAGGPVGSATKAPQFTWDSKGRLTAVDEVSITPAWSSITSKPTTFSELGVTMFASDLPNHASRHHWNGADPLTGQSISGLRTTDSPSFFDVFLSGNLFFGSIAGVGRNGSGGVYLRPSSGIVRLTVEDVETYCSNAFSAASGRFSNLSTGFVRSNSIGQLSSSALLASELPNHASRHHWDGPDSLTGQSINGLRTVDSPRFLNLLLDGELRFDGYSITTFSGDGFYVQTSGGDDLLKMTVAGGAIVGYGLFPFSNGLECGKDGSRWNFRSNDLNHEVEIVNATEGSAGTNIAAIPAIGNYFRLSAPTSGGYKNYRVPDNVSGIGKELVITATSTDPNGFLRVYAPNSGSLFVEGASVPYIDFVWGRKLVLHSDGVRWYV